ncbi:DUF4249 family protein [Chitinophaga qingshengii]|uniref:DUF4249 family protein n=1 Tax=Chitinophaga qingshengii TaxID=1569794 RepID=A0ABR7TSJ9_9BACT|nr:DUF4249 family protein [Chitinophaga qingshengii]MBC9933456.1 DUF4249 family protein [Chitinophaga qingshengii]
MKYLFQIWCVFSVAALTGCIRDLPVPPTSGKARAVVYSELVAGRKAEMRVGKSKPVGPDINNYFEPVTNATAQLLGADSQLLEQLHYVKDTSTNMAFYRGNTRIDANKTYYIQVKVPDTKDVTARTTIPPLIKVELQDSLRTTLNGRDVLRFHFNIQAPPANGKQFIVMEALKQLAQLDTIFTYRNVRYRVRDRRALFNQVKNEPGVTFVKDTLYLNSYLRIPVYTQDENADNNQVGGLNENYNSILFTQRGKPLNTQFYINATALTAGSTEVEPPIGRVLVNVKSVTQEYYDFLLTYEKVRRNPGLNSLIQAIQIRSNAIGGLGVIGGCSQVAYYLYYDNL